MTEPVPIADQVLAGKLAAIHDAHQTALDLLSPDLSPHLTPAQRAEATQAVGADYERQRALAQAEYVAATASQT